MNEVYIKNNLTLERDSLNFSAKYVHTPKEYFSKNDIIDCIITLT